MAMTYYDPIRPLCEAWCLAQAHAYIAADDPAPFDSELLGYVYDANPTVATVIVWDDPTFRPREHGDVSPERAAHTWIRKVCDVRDEVYRTVDPYVGVQSRVKRGRGKKGPTAVVQMPGVAVVAATHTPATLPLAVRRRDGGWNGADVARYADRLYGRDGLPALMGTDTAMDRPVIDSGYLPNPDDVRFEQVSQGARISVVRGGGARVALRYHKRASDPVATTTGSVTRLPAAGPTPDVMFLGHDKVKRAPAKGTSQGKRAARTTVAATVTLQQLAATILAMALKPGERAAIDAEPYDVTVTRSKAGIYATTVRNGKVTIGKGKGRTLDTIARTVERALATV